MGRPGTADCHSGGARDVDGDGLRNAEGELAAFRRPPPSDGLARLLSGDSSGEHLQPADAGRSRRPDRASRAGPIANDVGVVDRGHQPVQRGELLVGRKGGHPGGARTGVDTPVRSRRVLVVELHRLQHRTTGSSLDHRCPRPSLGLEAGGVDRPPRRRIASDRTERGNAQHRGDALAVAGVGRDRVRQCAHGIRSERGRVSDSGSSRSVVLRATSRIDVTVAAGEAATRSSSRRTSPRSSAASTA